MGLSASHSHRRAHQRTCVLWLELIQLAQPRLCFWRYLGCLVRLLVGLGLALSLLVVVLVVTAIFGRAFRGMRLLLWSRSTCAAGLLIFISYDKFWLELGGIGALSRGRCLAVSIL